MNQVSIHQFTSLSDELVSWLRLLRPLTNNNRRCLEMNTMSINTYQNVMCTFAKTGALLDFNLQSTISCVASSCAPLPITRPVYCYNESQMRLLLRGFIANVNFLFIEVIHLLYSVITFVCLFNMHCTDQNGSHDIISGHTNMLCPVGGILCCILMIAALKYHW